MPLTVEDINKKMTTKKMNDGGWETPPALQAEINIPIKFKKCHEAALMPVAAKDGDIGFDVSCCESFSLEKGEFKRIPTGLILADMPTMDRERNRIFLKVEGRSGLASKGVFPIGGIIDPVYRGEIGIILCNMGDTVSFGVGARIAQLVVYKVSTAGEVIIKETEVVTSTNRGSSGFGSTGV